MHTDQGVYSMCLCHLHGVGVLTEKMHAMSMQYFIISGLDFMYKVVSILAMHTEWILDKQPENLCTFYGDISGMVVHVQAVDTGLLSLLPHGLGARLMYIWRDNCGLLCCTSTSASESSARRELPGTGLLM